jgi:PAS domain S-box-containing protein
MTTSEAVTRDSRVRIAAYVGSPYTEERAVVETALASLDSVAVETLATLDAITDHEAAGADLVLVCTDEEVPDLPAGPVVRVTADPAAVRAASARDVLDVFTWAPTDDPALLAAQLHHRVETSFALSDPTDASKRLDDGVLALDADGTISYCNETMAALLGGQAASPTGDPLWAHVPDPVVDELESAIERVIDDRVPLSTEVALDDRGQRFEVTAFPAPEGAAIHVRAPTRRGDGVTDDDLYEYLIETVGDAVYILDTEGRFTFVNDALCEMTGYDREELIGSSVHIIKDDHTVEEAEDALRDLLRQRTSDDGAGIEIARLDVELVRKDGEHVPCTDRMTLRPLGEDGSFQGTVGTLRDVTRQKRRENILSGLLEAAGEMVTAETTAAVAENVLETAVEVLDIDLAGIRAHDPDRDVLELVATTDATADLLPDRPVYEADEGPVGEAFTTGELVVVDDLSHTDGSPENVSGGVYVPLGDSRVMSLGYADGETFDDDELRFVELLAATAAPVFDRVERDEERRRYEAVIEAADDMLFTLDEDGQFTLVTESFAAALGCEREELRGRAIDRVVADETVASAIATHADGVRTHETDLVTDDGELLPGRISVAPIENEVEAGVVGTVRDISDLRSAQREATQQRRRFSELFETLTDPVADIQYVDGEPVVRGGNPAFAALTDLEDLRDRPLDEVRDALPPGIAEALDPVTAPGDAAEASSASPDSSPPREAIERNLSARTADGERYFLLRTVPYESDDEPRAFVILTDVTDVKQRETQLQVLYRILRHNLRNRTTVIQGTAEEIAARDETGALEPLAENVLEASRALVEASETARQVQHVLERREPVEERTVEAVAETLADRVDGGFPGTDVTVRARTDGTLRYSEHVATAVLELVENAVEHTPGEPTVAVELTDGADDSVRIAVSDDGPGIPREEWAIVTGDREITQLQHASGLGLWLVKWVADTHGGTLSLARADGDGSTVCIDLPR